MPTTVTQNLTITGAADELKRFADCFVLAKKGDFSRNTSSIALTKDSRSKDLWVSSASASTSLLLVRRTVTSGLSPDGQMGQPVGRLPYLDLGGHEPDCQTRDGSLGLQF